MNKYNLLIKWNESINDWIIIYKEYIHIIKDYGLYNLGLVWTDSISIFNEIALTTSSTFKYMEDDIIKYFDNMELLLNKINILSNRLINKEIHDMLKSSDYKINIYNQTIVIKDNINVIFNEILNSNYIIDHFLNDLDIADLNHGMIVLKNYIHNLYAHKDLDKINKFKNNLFNKDEYRMTDKIHKIHRINYLILPLQLTEKSNNFVDISYSSQSITYNIMPLIDNKEAIKYGPLQFLSQGLNQQLYHRFNTISLKKINSNDKLPDTEIFTNNSIIYDGNDYKYLTPVNFSTKNKWNPLDGINITTLKKNEQFEKDFFKKINTEELQKNIKKYKNFNARDYDNSRYTDELLTNIKNNRMDKLEKIVTNQCINKLQSILINVNKNIEKEAYLSQYFNILSIIKNIRKNDFNSIEVIPIKYSFVFFKLI